MFKTILISELKSNLRQPLLYIFILIFISFTWFITINTGSVALSGFWISNVNNNSPYALTGIYATLSLLGLFVTITYTSGAALKDLKYKYHEILFTTSIQKKSYFFGRFLAANILSLIPFLFILPASLIASWFAPQNKIGTFILLPHISNILIIAIPNIILTSSIFFSIAIIKRNLIYPFVSCIVLLTFYSISIGLLTNIDNLDLINLLDPLGINATQVLTRYWSIAEKNNQVIYLTGGLLLNRVIWTVIGMIILLLFYKKFSFSIPKKRSKKNPSTSDSSHIPEFKPLKISNKKISLVFYNYYQQLWSQVLVELKYIVKSLSFKLIILVALLSLIIPAFTLSGTWYGTPSYPVTYKMIEVIRSTLSLIILFVIIIFYSGELIQKEKESNFNQIIDALPTPSWVYFISKITSLSLIVIIVLTSYMLGTILVQLTDGYFNIELTTYIKELFLIEFTYYLMVIIIAVLFQILTDSKYFGMFLTIIFFFALNNLEIEHNLIKFAGTPTHVYSDFNGFGRYAEAIFHYKIYWGIFSCLLLFLGNKLWKRGNIFNINERYTHFLSKLNTKDYVIIAAIISTFFIYGSYIFYNTNILNTYENQNKVLLRKASYEKKYKIYAETIQPKITDVNLNVDIYPYDNKVQVKGTYLLKNKSKTIIDTLLISSLPGENKNGWALDNLKISNANQVFYDSSLEFYKYKLNKNLLPGDSLIMDFTIKYKVNGFENDVSYVRVSENGSFVDLHDFSPHIGYNSNIEIKNKNNRNKYNLPKSEGLPSLADSNKINQSLYLNNSDWVNYKCIISTANDQIAIAPGNMKKQWVSNNRNYYEYGFDVPVVNFFSFISGKYKVKKEKWNNIDIEVYYLPKHHFNIDKMIKSAKNTLQYCSENFYPYPYKQARIIEFPKFASFAQAFPGTMPYSESIGFIADLRDKNDIDQVNFVVSHEIAHQWWGGMLVGANCKGVTVMSETLAQYVAFMVMEKDLGKAQIHKFLKYELDKYLSARGKAFKEEPLLYNEAQPYVHYNKGAIAMYNIREIAGEKRLNNSLKEYFKQAAYRPDPYTNSEEFIEHIYNVVPDSLKYIVKDLFMDITLYNNKTKTATYKKLKNGKYLLNLEFECNKFKADQKGNEKQTKLDDWIDIGVYSKNEDSINLIYANKIKIDKTHNSIELIVDQKPYKAGIDPNYLLIDKKTDDNMIKMEEIIN